MIFAFTSYCVLRMFRKRAMAAQSSAAFVLPSGFGFRIGTGLFAAGTENHEQAFNLFTPYKCAA
jgi:hypothetical protein